MAKASLKKDKTVEERDCCRRVREQQMDSIRTNYLSFPVIKSMPCPTCHRILQIRVYERPRA
ncbi:MAG TPA: hypothetical protein VEI94_07490 [Candidatus Bathyarchaeia archaeon]|nr:hypothetical protein [Candidatus Bathyarchaeia archaeon]